MAITLKFSKSDAAIPWGFRLVGGLDFDQPIVVVKVNENSIAESADLQVGDILVRVNDTPTAGLTHNEVHDLLFSAGLELELGIRRGDIMTRIISDEEYDIEASNVIKKVIEEEVLNEAVNIINNFRNVQDVSGEATQLNEIENLLGQEEIVNTVTLQTTSNVKKGSWSTFLVKPEKPIPKSKRRLEERKAEGEPYKVVIKKQTRRLSQEKKVKFDQNVIENEIECDEEEEETQSIPQIHETDLEQSDDEVKFNVTENQEIWVEDDEEVMNVDGDIEIKDEAQETELGRRENSVVTELDNLQSLKYDERVEISPSLEEQLLAVQKQLQTLSQLPSAIQTTLDAVSRQLATIVCARESAERNGDQTEYTSSSKEEEEPETEEEYLEDTSVSEKAEAEMLRENSSSNCSIIDELEEDGGRLEDIRESQEEVKEETEPEVNSYGGLTPEERESLIKKEELEIKQKKTMDERSLKPIQRPIILPGGRKWSIPEDAIPSFRKPKMSEEKIIETIENNLEVIIGKRKGESNCWMVPSKVVAAKRINFLKYQPPPKNLDYLQRSEVYRLVHDMEPPVRGITSRPEKVPAVQDYYEATQGVP